MCFFLGGSERSLALTRSFPPLRSSEFELPRLHGAVALVAGLRSSRESRARVVSPRRPFPSGHVTSRKRGPSCSSSSSAATTGERACVGRGVRADRCACGQVCVGRGVRADE